MSNLVPVTVAYGEGIGPEIMEASLHIIQEAGARIQIEKIEIGEKVYLRGNTAGIEPIDNRGVKVWPDGMAQTLCTDAYRCRFESMNGTTANVALLNQVLDQGIEIVKTENLRTFDGQKGYTLAQGQ